MAASATIKSSAGAALAGANVHGLAAIGLVFAVALQAEAVIRAAEVFRLAAHHFALVLSGAAPVSVQER